LSQVSQPSKSSWLLVLGPGILFASTSIGVSHLVQSTRAGADYSLGLLWAVVLANALKYPFFEYGSRYASATGESLIDGYHQLGRWALWLYLLLTLVTMFFVAAAVSAVTVGFFDRLFGLSGFFPVWGERLALPLLLSFCVGLLMRGRYHWLDRFTKVIGTLLLFSTLAAVLLLLYRGPQQAPISWFSPQVWELGSPHFFFLIALMGWMPTALDLSTWNSLWTVARRQQTGYQPPLRHTLREFGASYLISALLAPCFMLLGAYLIYGAPGQMPAQAADFAAAIVQLYVTTFGSWSRILITAAAFSIMLGTILAVFDGYARSARKVWQLSFPSVSGRVADHGYQGILLLLALVAWCIVHFFGGALPLLVDLATTLSFVVAPIIAGLNYHLVTRRAFPAFAKPGRGMRIWSFLGLAFLSSFSLVYLYSRFLAS